MMELTDLKSGWQNAGEAFKNEADLLKMTKITNHPSLKKIRMKLIAETIFLLFFLVIYYDWFDGNKKPLYANALLVTGLLLYIGNDVIGYLSIVKPVNGLNLKTSLKNYLVGIKRLSVFSLVFSILYAISLLAFFASSISFTREKRFLLLGLVIVLCQLMLWSYKVWTNRIKKLEQQVKDFAAEEDK